MTRAINVIEALKSQLKLSGVTYRKLASRLNLSESSVKQMFASGNFSLKRLDEICEVLSIDLAELIEITVGQESRIEELGIALETELVADIRMLLMAYCLVNYWSVEEILHRYTLNEQEAIQILAKLDRMKLIELLPGNKVRLLIGRNFKWLENGPIEKFFRTQVQGEFFRGNFNADGALRLIKNGDITRKGQRQLVDRLQAVGSLFEDICREERKQPITKRQGTTMILAIRNWEFTAFSSIERQQDGA